MSSNVYLLLTEFMAQARRKQGRENRGPITYCTDRASEANKLFIKWLCQLSRKGTKSSDVSAGDQELEGCTAT